jgi:hypothetical protein
MRYVHSGHTSSEDEQMAMIRNLHVDFYLEALLLNPVALSLELGTGMKR